MISPLTLIISAVVLGAFTYGFRVAGPLLHGRMAPSPQMQEWMTSAATVLLVALCVTSAFADGKEWSDPARPIAVAVAGLAAWFRAPFLVVVLIAAVTAAGIRLVV